ncbi:hypothetical protein DP44_5731 [Burkholderia pseudomallei]|nr:hypothetical protein DP44_5731 [Burkholderia pseudomallei]
MSRPRTNSDEGPRKGGEGARRTACPASGEADPIATMRSSSAQAHLSGMRLHRHAKPPRFAPPIPSPLWSFR